MISEDRKVARYLLEIEAVQLRPEKPFTWASGWKSPIYTDNRKILSYPEIREKICERMIKVIGENFAEADVIAGVATGAIAYGAIIAHILNKPFVYIRPKPKTHGTEAQIEGRLPENASVVIIEDLISTGQSSLSAANVLQKEGATIVGMVAIFSYNFSTARRGFENANIELRTLTDYETLIDEALAIDYIKESDVEMLKEWRFSPETWSL